MNLLDRLAHWWLFKRAAYDSAASVMFGGGQSQSTAWRYTDYVQQAYKLNPVVYACLARIRQALQSLEVGIEKGGEEQDLDKPIASLKPVIRLLNRANSNQSFAEYVGLWSDQMYLAGITFNRFYGAGTDGTGRGLTKPEMWLYRPDWTGIIHNATTITSYVYKPDGTEKAISIPVTEMFNVKFTDPLDPFAGMSPLTACGTVIDSLNAAQTWNYNLMRNSGVPSGVLTLKNPQIADPERRKSVEKQFTDSFAGVDNAGRTVVVYGEASDYRTMGGNARDLDWAGTKQTGMREICSALGVPSVLLGDPASRTYNNMESAKQDFYYNTIVPLMELFLEEFGNFIFPLYRLDDCKFVVGTDNILELNENEDQIAARTVQSDWLSINEQRAIMGLDEYKADPQADIPRALLKLTPPVVSEFSKRSHADDVFEPSPDSLLPTLADRARYLGRIHAIMDRWYPSMERALIAYWEAQARRVTDRLDPGRSANDAINSRFVSGYPPAITDIFDLTREAQEYAETVGPVERALFIELGREALEMIAKGTLFETDRPSIEQWLAKELSERSHLINKTTAKEIQAILVDNIGTPWTETAKIINESIVDMTQRRAKLIARTEVTRANTMASREGYAQASEKLGTQVGMEWVTARDEKVRASHNQMDGQVANAQGMFSYLGREFQGPGMLGEPGFDINCRCGVAPIVTGVPLLAGLGV
ncbi:MAG TPA: phage portal protein [Dissulfurispiraceae bacterium]|nr:phage portal protein [Dissulfurispiraceae bacterium]